MDVDVDYLIEKARKYKMTEEEQEEQRKSFAYGNAVIENHNITRELINKVSDGILGK